MRTQRTRTTIVCVGFALLASACASRSSTTESPGPASNPSGSISNPTGASSNPTGSASSPSPQYVSNPAPLVKGQP